MTHSKRVARRIFSPNEMLEDARAGRLTGRALIKAIRMAEDFGNTDVASELRLYRVTAATFPDDDSPKDARERLAQALSVLLSMGKLSSRTLETAKKYGAIETLHRLVNQPKASQGFEQLRMIGKESLTAESIVLDYPNLFKPRVVKFAAQRIRNKTDIERT